MWRPDSITVQKRSAKKIMVKIKRNSSFLLGDRFIFGENVFKHLRTILGLMFPPTKALPQLVSLNHYQVWFRKSPDLGDT